MLDISCHKNIPILVNQCVDIDPESVAGLNAHSLPTALVEPLCNGLSCAPYDDEKELTCVVCTR